VGIRCWNADFCRFGGLKHWKHGFNGFSQIWRIRSCKFVLKDSFVKPFEFVKPLGKLQVLVGDGFIRPEVTSFCVNFADLADSVVQICVAEIIC